jgi:hypothetical protein
MVKNTTTVTEFALMRLTVTETAAAQRWKIAALFVKAMEPHVLQIFVLMGWLIAVELAMDPRSLMNVTFAEEMEHLVFLLLVQKD